MKYWLVVCFIVIISIISVKTALLVYWRLDNIYGMSWGTRVPSAGTKWLPGIWPSKWVTFKYHINKHGYRGKWHKKCDILCLGDSRTFGWNSYKSYPEYLAEYTGLRVVNMGIPGKTIQECVANLTRDGVRLKPRIIIYYGGFGEPGDNSCLRYLSTRTQLYVIKHNYCIEKAGNKNQKQAVLTDKEIPAGYRLIENNLSAKYFSTYCHYNDIGNRMLAKRVVEAIR